MNMAHTLSAHQLDWLKTRGSLTARLLQQLPHLHIQLITRGCYAALPEEEQALGLRRHTLVWVREILMRSKEQTLLFARSVMPYNHRCPQSYQLQRMHEHPLSELVFASPRIRRSTFIYKKLTPTHDLWPRLTAQNCGTTPALNARSSKFLWPRGAPLLLTEVFLPPLLTLPTD
jgi:chorismate--pyruvate lyase